MTECTVLGYLGSPIGTKEMQISLAHGFGDGKEESCEYAREAVEGLLLGESIDFYVAMNMDGISELNDLAGGVTVTLEDDFSSIDPAMAKGTDPDAAWGPGRDLCPQPDDGRRWDQRQPHGTPGGVPWSRPRRLQRSEFEKVPFVGLQKAVAFAATAFFLLQNKSKGEQNYVRIPNATPQ